MRDFQRFGYLLALVSLLGCEARPVDDAEPQAAIEVGKEGEPTVGVVDYQRIYTVLGIGSELIERREKLQAEFNRVANEMRLERVKRLKEFGGDVATLNTEQREELVQLEQSRRIRLAQLERENDREMKEAVRWLDRVFRQKTKGPIEEIAKSRGLKVVIVQLPSQVAYFEPGVDITEAVVQRLGDTVLQEGPIDAQGSVEQEVADGPAKASEE
ncbi:MAG: OmpH family outer membrane protein [Pirellulales bacterium]|nr:OmpH family outer membrane protein [Pirellulales bacterium]